MYGYGTGGGGGRQRQDEGGEEETREEMRAVSGRVLALPRDTRL